MWPSRKTKQSPLCGARKGTLGPLRLLCSPLAQRHPKTPALGDWRAIDPHSIQVAQHQSFPARFFSALWNILDCFLLLLCTLSTTCWFLFPSACQSDEGTARSDSSMSLPQPPHTSAQGRLCTRLHPQPWSSQWGIFFNGAPSLTQIVHCKYISLSPCRGFLLVLQGFKAQSSNMLTTQLTALPAVS